MSGRTYRYMKGKAQYPFGYGLTYGKAEVRSVEVVETETGANVFVKVEIRAKEIFVRYCRSISSVKIRFMRFQTRSYAGSAE